jgi:hypothetical protein
VLSQDIKLNLYIWNLNLNLTYETEGYKKTKDSRDETRETQQDT